MNCTICKERIDGGEDQAIYLCDAYRARLGRRDGPYGPQRDYAHFECVSHPLRLNPDNHRKWLTLNQDRINAAISELNTRITATENALLELPPDMAPQFRDQIAHDRQTYATVLSTVC